MDGTGAKNIKPPAHIKPEVSQLIGFVLLILQFVFFCLIQLIMGDLVYLMSRKPLPPTFPISKFVGVVTPLFASCTCFVLFK